MPQGTVKWFSTQKGYGFITQDEGGDIFVHVTGLAPGTTGLDENQRVEFELSEGRKGPQATDVKPRPRRGLSPVLTCLSARPARAGAVACGDRPRPCSFSRRLPAGQTAVVAGWSPPLTTKGGAHGRQHRLARARLVSHQRLEDRLHRSVAHRRGRAARRHHPRHPRALRPLRQGRHRPGIAAVDRARRPGRGHPAGVGRHAHGGAGRRRDGRRRDDPRRTRLQHQQVPRTGRRVPPARRTPRSATWSSSTAPPTTTPATPT